MRFNNRTFDDEESTQKRTKSDSDSTSSLSDILAQFRAATASADEECPTPPPLLSSELLLGRELEDDPEQSLPANGVRLASQYLTESDTRQERSRLSTSNIAGVATSVLDRLRESVRSIDPTLWSPVGSPLRR